MGWLVKLFSLLLVSTVFCNVYAVECITKYDKNGCKKVSYDVGSGMVIEQYQVIYDKDQDGVVDSLDKCSGTPFNSKVDVLGCALTTTPKQVETKSTQDKVLEAVKESQLAVVQLDIEFDTLQSKVKEIYKDEIKKFATYMLKNPSYFAKIVGHTDSKDRYSVNKELSLSRADAVKAALVKQGVKSERMQTVGMGPNEPIASNATAEGRAKNRRIEVIITTKERN